LKAIFLSGIQVLILSLIISKFLAELFELDKKGSLLPYPVQLLKILTSM